LADFIAKGYVSPAAGHPDYAVRGLSQAGEAAERS